MRDHERWALVTFGALVLIIAAAKVTLLFWGSNHE